MNLNKDNLKEYINSQMNNELNMRIKEQKQKAALDYLYDNLAFANCKDMTMQEYFDKKYGSNCYYYSTYIMMCMRPTDKLVRGEVTTKGDDPIKFRHGWVEFKYKNDWFVYDSLKDFPVLLEDYYKETSGVEIETKITKSNFIKRIKETKSDMVSIEEKDGITKITTKDFWDPKYKAPLENAEIVLDKDKVVEMNIDCSKEKEFKI